MCYIIWWLSVIIICCWVKHIRKDVWSCDLQANWVPRRENNDPKKIDQIHQEAKQEEAEKMRELAAHPGLPMGSRQISKGLLDMDRKKNIKDGGSKMESDWSGGGDKDKKPPPKFEASKFRNLGKVCCYGNCMLVYTIHGKSLAGENFGKLHR